MYSSLMSNHMITSCKYPVAACNRKNKSIKSNSVYYIVYNGFVKHAPGKPQGYFRSLCDFFNIFLEDDGDDEF